MRKLTKREVQWEMKLLVTNFSTSNDHCIEYKWIWKRLRCRECDCPTTVHAKRGVRGGWGLQRRHAKWHISDDFHLAPPSLNTTTSIAYHHHSLAAAAAPVNSCQTTSHGWFNPPMDNTWWFLSSWTLGCSPIRFPQFQIQHAQVIYALPSISGVFLHESQPC